MQNIKNIDFMVNKIIFFEKGSLTEWNIIMLVCLPLPLASACDVPPPPQTAAPWAPVPSSGGHLLVASPSSLEGSSRHWVAYSEITYNCTLLKLPSFTFKYTGM